MLQLNSHSTSADEKRFFAEAADFEELFAKQNTDLLRLSLHLMADVERAEICLLLALKDCLARSDVSKHRARAWARRMVVRNATRLIWGTSTDIPGESEFEFSLQPSDLPLDELRESVAIPDLPDLDRLAFVMCVLERYSILDSALLLRRTPQDVYDAIVRATDRVLPPGELKNDATASRFPGRVFGPYWDQGSKLDVSCGAILD